MKTYSKSILPELDGWEERLELALQNVEANRTIGKQRSKDGEINHWAKKRRSLDECLADLLHLIEVCSPEDCWRWKGLCYKQGYGRIFPITWGEESYNKAHRVMAAFRYGPIKPHQLACHHCDNPPCCNPHHLFIGTHKENLGEMHLKGRHHQPLGSDHHNSRLSEEQVREIKSHLPFPKYGWISALSRKFKVAPESIRDAARGITWTHIPGPIWVSSRPYTPPKKSTK